LLVNQEHKGGKWKVSLACSRGIADHAWGFVRWLTVMQKYWSPAVQKYYFSMYFFIVKVEGVGEREGRDRGRKGRQKY
jgi:hypothetical protein